MEDHLRKPSQAVEPLTLHVDAPQRVDVAEPVELPGENPPTFSERLVCDVGTVRSDRIAIHRFHVDRPSLPARTMCLRASVSPLRWPSVGVWPAGPATSWCHIGAISQEKCAWRLHTRTAWLGA